jgi:hypothetical protein
MEPAKLIRCKNESLKDRKYTLKSFTGRDYNYSLDKHLFSSIMAEGEVSGRVVGNV